MDGRSRALPDEVVLTMVEEMRAQGHGFDAIRRATNVSKSRWERLMAIRDGRIEAEREKAQAASRKVVGAAVKLCRVGLSIRNRLGAGPSDAEIAEMARVYRRKQAEQVAARSARIVQSVQSSAHHPRTMQGPGS
jgi:hypothetical protein